MLPGAMGVAQPAQSCLGEWQVVPLGSLGGLISEVGVVGVACAMKGC